MADRSPLRPLNLPVWFYSNNWRTLRWTLCIPVLCSVVYSRGRSDRHGHLDALLLPRSAHEKQWIEASGQGRTVPVHKDPVKMVLHTYFCPIESFHIHTHILCCALVSNSTPPQDLEWQWQPVHALIFMHIITQVRNRKAQTAGAFSYAWLALSTCLRW